MNQLNPNSGTILVVDDEELITRVLGKQLERLGFAVVVCTLPSQAIVLVEASASKFALAIIDYIMPEMNGLALAAVLHARQPTLPILLNTGTLLDQSHFDPAAYGVKGVLQKPSPIDELSQVVNRALAHSE